MCAFGFALGNGLPEGQRKARRAGRADSPSPFFFFRNERVVTLVHSVYLVQSRRSSHLTPITESAGAEEAEEVVARSRKSPALRPVIVLTVSRRWFSTFILPRHRPELVHGAGYVVLEPPVVCRRSEAHPLSLVSIDEAVPARSLSRRSGRGKRRAARTGARFGVSSSSRSAETLPRSRTNALTHLFWICKHPSATPFFAASPPR